MGFESRPFFVDPAAFLLAQRLKIKLRLAPQTSYEGWEIHHKTNINKPEILRMIFSCQHTQGDCNFQIRDKIEVLLPAPVEHRGFDTIWFRFNLLHIDAEKLKPENKINGPGRSNYEKVIWIIEWLKPENKINSPRRSNYEKVLHNLNTSLWCVWYKVIEHNQIHVNPIKAIRF